MTRRVMAMPPLVVRFRGEAKSILFTLLGS
jgi:hypothetical protein